MCGRFTITMTAGLAERFHLQDPLPGLQPRYNIAPSQEVPVICGIDQHRMVMMTWGLVPLWSRDPSTSPRPINARAESLLEKPMFRGLISGKRCLIPATGFYEWRRERDRKIPCYIRLRSGGVFAFAGLYDTRKEPGHTSQSSFTIITTAANGCISSVHPRMPAILRYRDEERWLGGSMLQPDEMMEMLEPYPAGEMEIYQVSPAVNSPKNDGPELIQPLG